MPRTALAILCLFASSACASAPATRASVDVVAGAVVLGTLTLELRDVPLDRAFLVALSELGLGFREWGGVLVIEPLRAPGAAR